MVADVHCSVSNANDFGFHFCYFFVWRFTMQYHRYMYDPIIRLNQNKLEELSQDDKQVSILVVRKRL